VKTGVQKSFKGLKILESGFRWNDGKYDKPGSSQLQGDRWNLGEIFNSLRAL
jgi:hypothetical protein